MPEGGWEERRSFGCRARRQFPSVRGGAGRRECTPGRRTWRRRTWRRPASFMSTNGEMLVLKVPVSIGHRLMGNECMKGCTFQ